jgi:hypothetical protein
MQQGNGSFNWFDVDARAAQLKAGYTPDVATVGKGLISKNIKPLGG